MTSTSVAALPSIVTSTPTSPLQKRPKLEGGVDKFDDVSPVFDRKFDEKKSSDVDAADGKTSARIPAEEAAKKIVPVEAEALSNKFGRHRVVKVDRPKFGEIFVSLEGRGRKMLNCTLKGSWLNSEIQEGDTVNLVRKSQV